MATVDVKRTCVVTLQLTEEEAIALRSLLGYGVATLTLQQLGLDVLYRKLSESFQGDVKYTAFKGTASFQ